MHGRQKRSLQPERCVCGDQNVEPVILMSTGSLLFISFLFFDSLLHILDMIMSCMLNIILRTIELN